MIIRVGVISDTHGLLRNEAIEALRGSDHIVHAGDIGNASIIDALAALAPVTAVRGNNDNETWADGIPHTAYLTVGNTSIVVLHDIDTLPANASLPNHHVIIAGHSHRPRVETRGHVLHVNPGSAGPRRFRLPIAVAHIEIEGDRVSASIEDLDVSSKRASTTARSTKR